MPVHADSISGLATGAFSGKMHSHDKNMSPKAIREMAQQVYMKAPNATLPNLKQWDKGSLGALKTNFNEVMNNDLNNANRLARFARYGEVREMGSNAHRDQTPSFSQIKNDHLRDMVQTKATKGMNYEQQETLRRDMKTEMGDWKHDVTSTIDTHVTEIQGREMQKLQEVMQNFDPDALSH